MEPSSPQPLNKDQLLPLYRRLVHISGASLPPEPPVSLEELLKTLDSLVEMCARRLARQRAAQQANREMQDELVQVERLKGEFIQNVTHELRTPLASIEGFAMALLRGMDGPQNGGGGEEMPRETRQRFLNIISQEARRLGELIEDVLFISEIETHPMNAEPAVFPAREVFLDALATFRTRWGERKAAPVRLECAPDPDGPTIYANREAVREILRHLLDNAHKYSGGQEILLCAAPEAPSADGLPQARLAVRDRGIGIPRAQLPFIFSKFHRVETAAHTIPGTGLGLAIVRTLTQQNGGRVEADSDLGQGALFTVHLPSVPVR